MRADDLLPRGLVGASYYDVVVSRLAGFETAVRGGELEEHEWSVEELAVRVLAGGYGAASSSRVSGEEAGKLAAKALRLAVASPSSRLAPAKPGRGKAAVRTGLGAEDVARLAREVYGVVSERLGKLAGRIEVVATLERREKSIASSEGASIEECVESLVLVAYAVGEHGRVRAATAAGGSGTQRIVPERLAERLAEIAGLQGRARALSPFYRGYKFKVVLDWECTGGLAHEVAHALEADVYRGGLVSKPQEAVFVDSPRMSGGYGYAFWDDEAVETSEKKLLSPEGAELLHTRATAALRPGSRPGNARGLSHKPRPSMRNVFLAPGDWREDEILQDSGRGFLLVGLEEARLDSSTGYVAIKPQAAVYFEDRGEKSTPVAGVVLLDSLASLVSRLDAAARRVRARPNIEKGMPVSEGGPYSRISEARIDYAAV